ncbi:unnamed protein product, partial [Choristocarpus tenellus]
GPHLRRAIKIFRAINKTGLQVRAGAGISSPVCGRLEAGSMFSVNNHVIVNHQERKLRRLHVVKPLVGWVTGLTKWVEMINEEKIPVSIPLTSFLEGPCTVVTTTGFESRRHVAHGMKETREEDNCAFQQVSPRARWLRFRSDLAHTHLCFPANSNCCCISGSDYSPNLSSSKERPRVTVFMREQRFLSPTIRCLGKKKEHQEFGANSPGPAMYCGHDELTPILPKRVGKNTRQNYNSQKQEDGQVRRKKKGTASQSRMGGRNFWMTAEQTRSGVMARKDIANNLGPASVGIHEREVADTQILGPKAGKMGTLLMRPLMSSPQRSCWLAQGTGCSSPGPVHCPALQLCRTGSPVFASPIAVDTRVWEKQNEWSGTGEETKEKRRSKASQVLLRWPDFVHDKFSGGFQKHQGADSPGPGGVNITSHDPFRKSSFLKIGVCRPP